MKTAILCVQKFMNQPYIALPNAATRKQVLDRIVDKLLILVCCIGIVTGIIFIISIT